jgi:serine-type D-Ala-D-Ala endopeptidase (penicillin-binding protein 7)
MPHNIKTYVSVTRATLIFSLALGLAVLSPSSFAASRKPAPKAELVKTKAKTKAPAQAASRKAAANGPRLKSQARITTKAGKAAALVASKSKRERIAVAYVTVRGKHGKMVRVAQAVPRANIIRVSIEPPRQSFGQMAGLHNMQDELELKSSVALVMDQDTREVLFSKNENAVLPIASLTKLMTGMIITEAHLDMQEMIGISQDDVDTEKGSRSRLAVGTELSRGELLHLALMSSENRAAHALGRTYPGGMPVFVAQMNARAKQLGMAETRYVEPTGLSSRNQSSAHDLARLVATAYHYPLLREYSTSTGYQVPVGERTIQFNNTNRLVNNPDWEIGLQKTGFISEAGQCLVMQAKVAGRKLIMVFLDSAGKFSRLGDAERVRKWVESTPIAAPQRVSTISLASKS